MEKAPIIQNRQPQQSRHFESTFKGQVGSISVLKQACKKLGYVRTICKQSANNISSKETLKL